MYIHSEPHQCYIFASTVKYNLKTQKEKESLLFCPFFCLLYFLPDISMFFLLSFPFCLEKFIELFLQSRSAGDKFSIFLYSKIFQFLLHYWRIFLLAIGFWVVVPIFQRVKNAILLSFDLCDFWLKKKQTKLLLF